MQKKIWGFLENFGEKSNFTIFNKKSTTNTKLQTKSSILIPSTRIYNLYTKGIVYIVKTTL